MLRMVHHSSKTQAMTSQWLLFPTNDIAAPNISDLWKCAVEILQLKIVLPRLSSEYSLFISWRNALTAPHYVNHLRWCLSQGFRRSITVLPHSPRQPELTELFSPGSNAVGKRRENAAIYCSYCCFCSFMCCFSQCLVKERTAGLAGNLSVIHVITEYRAKCCLGKIKIQGCLFERGAGVGTQTIHFHLFLAQFCTRVDCLTNWLAVCKPDKVICGERSVQQDNNW